VYNENAVSHFAPEQAWCAKWWKWLWSCTINY